MIDILIKYILWYNFSNDMDAQSDLKKLLPQKKLVKYPLNQQIHLTFWALCSKFI